jgi:subtilase family serine protease
MNATLKRYFRSRLIIFATSLCLTAPAAHAQARRTIPGHIHPLAQPKNDKEAMDPAARMNYMTAFLKRSARQQSDLDDLTQRQQDLTSPVYHHWLTPEQYADRFGSSQPEIDRLSEWLRSNGFSDLQVSRGRDFIVFNGTVAQVQAALRTPIHRYDVNGETHYANTMEPTVPENLEALVAGFRGLHNFSPKPFLRRGPWPPIKLTGARPSPQFYASAYPGVNVLAPDDLSTIYNIDALYKSGIDGAGQTVAIAGESDIDMSDIEYFRSVFNLPFNDPRKILVPGSDNPGFNTAMGEADLDLEWSGAIARNATILYVYSGDAFTSAFHVIDEAIAPVLSFSFGACELRVPRSDVDILAAEAQKAAVEGITWVASSGDAGAAGCEDQNAPFNSAITRMNPNLPASLPYVTGVGGSEFAEGQGKYWASKPGANGGSALGYVPEGGWTDESFIAQNDYPGFASSGGGASWLFSKPAWQTALGMPNDNARDVPDVALTASWFHDPYSLITGGSFVPNGGTSAAAPAFAGIVALINQYLARTGANGSGGLGLINPMLYSLAQTTPAAFHDIVTGSNIVPCVALSTQDCASGSMGYNAGQGYDQVTGLGSVDAYTMALNWHGAISKAAHLVITHFTASTAARVGGAFTVSTTIANQGNLDAGAFQTGVYFTSDGTIASAKQFSLACDVKGLAVGATTTCSGTVDLDFSIVPGIYRILAVVDVNKSVPQSDRSAGIALASSGPLTVTQ